MERKQNRQKIKEKVKASKSNPSEKNENPSEKKGRKSYISAGVIIVCVCVALYTALHLISGNIRLSKLQQTAAEKKAEYEENEIEKKELEEIKKSGNTDEYVIKVAKEKLGLAFSDEKVYKDRD